VFRGASVFDHSIDPLFFSSVIHSFGHFLAQTIFIMIYDYLCYNNVQKSEASRAQTVLPEFLQAFPSEKCDKSVMAMSQYLSISPVHGVPSCLNFTPGGIDWLPG
jgi:hypothetical protein